MEYWPLLVVLAVALVVVVGLLNGPRLFRGTTTVPYGFWCRFRDRPVAVDFEETVWDGRRVDVKRCSAFDPPTAVACDKRCLREPVLRVKP